MKTSFVGLLFLTLRLSAAAGGPIPCPEIPDWEKCANPAGSARLLNDCGAMKYKLGEYGAAEKLLRQSIASKHETDAELATAVFNLAAVYRAEARFADAAPLYVRAISMRTQIFGPADPSLAAPLHGLAAIYQSQGKIQLAEYLNRRALTIR